MDGPDPNIVLREFASQFGGLIPSMKEVAGMDDPFSAAALDCAKHFLQAFEGQRNSQGLEFKYAIGFFDDMQPNAFCGFVAGQFCIGVNAGMHAKIFEISAALVRAFWGKESAAFSDGSLDNLGFNTLPALLEGNDKHMDFMRRVMAPLQKEALTQEFLYVSNILLLFIIIHEIRHATDGHVLFIASLEPLAFMEESDSGLASIHPVIRQYCELCADSDAIITILSHLAIGRTFFEIDRPYAELFQAVWLGTMLLANTWADVEESTTHPLATDRIINLWQCGFRVKGNDGPFASPAMADAVTSVIARLVELHPSFQRLAMAVSEEGHQRYRDLVKERSSNPDVWLCKKIMERLTFDPRRLAILREGDQPRGKNTPAVPKS